MDDGLYIKRNVWEQLGADEKAEVFTLGEKFKSFMDAAKTERFGVKAIIEEAKKHGFVSLEEAGALKAGRKIYCENRGKNVILAVIGEESLEEGVNVVGCHLDSPRLDIKQNPLYEGDGMALMKTHYYGLLRKYQWVALPLALYGVVITGRGEKLEIAIGDEEDDPVFYVSDILPHLGKDQNIKSLEQAVTGEDMNLIVGSLPADGKDNRFKRQVLNILNKKYGICEEDFLSAELQAVPAGKARDVGFDRSMVAAYGQDDKVCAFTALEAILNVNNNRKTAVAFFVDKEEIGNVGATGMHSRFFENVLTELLFKENEKYCDVRLGRLLTKSNVLSADVAAAMDPTHPEILERQNAAVIGHGISIVKYTGANGKEGANDANAEYLGYIRRIFHENHIVWQTAELGKCDQGGGGTIAYVMANHNMNVVDVGVPVLSMHAPYELTSKPDIYMTVKAYRSFWEEGA
ncbi:aminopeptidase [Bariatricus massiliensis]|uniref:aminopeptidase n=1 Tax=Bariatricus massiliensis TaxID=1745713 RepID=UPI00082ED11E|nr:aminopeptidase [Bariatricus massiliensis]